MKIISLDTKGVILFYQVILITSLILMILDILLTNIGLNRGWLEGNPVIDYFFQQFGLFNASIGLLIVAGLFTWLAYEVVTKSKDLRVFTGMVTFIVAKNIMQFLIVVDWIKVLR